MYLCRAQAKGLKAGNLLLFYLSKDERLEWSQSVTTAGIVECWQESTTSDDLMRFRKSKRGILRIYKIDATTSSIAPKHLPCGRRLRALRPPLAPF